MYKILNHEQGFILSNSKGEISFVDLELQTTFHRKFTNNEIRVIERFSND